ncbi:BURP domain protein [Medicago truncatula]|uniref:BURP domain protein n=1 Tax=Medicago truncatula TaxID=3880 RepID=A0A072UL76_MEDTR|nr:BURP domain protein [Medicago truncatula]
MATTPLALKFLTVVLFFFMIGQDINARDLKVELQDHDQVDSNDKPYITQYGGSRPNYPASYTTTKHNKHISHLEKLSEPYMNGGYRLAYGKHEAKNPDYTTGYKTHTHESNEKLSEPYMNGGYRLAYGKHEAKNADYTTGYKTHTHESNEKLSEPYMNGGYRLAYGKHEAKNPDYITGYKTHTPESHESNELYVSAYGNHEAKQPNYLIGNISVGNDPKDPPSTTSKDLEGSQSPNLDRTEAFKVGFFNLDDLYVGNVMTLQFPVQVVSPFLSKKEADSIPLAMSQLPSVLQLLSIPEDSPQAKSMINSLGECESETITGETKTCANSLESMLEFVNTIFGSDAKISILTTNKPSPTAVPLQKYTILEVSHDIDAPKWVACHPLSYPYAIYFCHYIATGTRVFKVSLVGDENGDKMEAVGICHLDTSDWNPDHIIFRQLSIKAGKNSPVCHFLPVNHLLWVPMQPSKATM